MNSKILRNFVLPLAIILSLFSGKVAISASIHGSTVGTCLPTVPAFSPVYPGKGKVAKSNKLLKPAGKSQLAAGQELYLSGHVYDKNCVPLSNAKIELWQANPDGIYLLPSKGNFANPYPLFAGTGTAYTDSNGQYGFVTLFPGIYQKRAPHLNMKISHGDMKKSLFVDMYFAGDNRNIDDIFYKRVPENLRKRIEAKTKLVTDLDPNIGVEAIFDITVKNTVDSFRRF